MAPIMGDVWTVSKKARKFFDSITSVMTPLSYPKRNDPVAANAARPIVKPRPMLNTEIILPWAGDEPI